MTYDQAQQTLRLPLRGGRCAVRRWCGIGRVRSPLQECCARCAFARRRLCRSGIGTCKGGQLLRGDRMKAISCVGRRIAAPRNFCVAVPRRCAQRVLFAVPRRSAHSPCICVVPRSPAHSARIFAALFIVALAPPRRAKRAGKIHRFATLALHSLLCVHLFACATPARRGTQKGWMPGSPSERCTGRRRANWSWCS